MCTNACERRSFNDICALEGSLEAYNAMHTGMISVLQFSNSDARGGAEEHILTLLRGLDREVFHLHLVCSPALVKLFGTDIPRDVEVTPLLLETPTQLRAALRLSAVLRGHRIDVLHSHLFRSTVLSAPIGRMSGVPLIVETTHVRESWRRGLKSYYFIDRLVARFVDRFVAVSKANAEFLIRQKGIPEAKVEVIQNGVDIRCFDASRPVPLALKRNLGFDDNDLVLVVGARLEPQKGHSTLLGAMRLIIDRYPHARLVCVGDGSCRRALEEQTAALGLAHVVRFVGYQANMADWLALADVAVLSSFYEGLPLIAIEALAAGRPMVATSVDGTPDVVVNERTGLTVPPGDANALAGAIIRLLDDPALRLQFGRAGRRWVEERFDRRVQIRQTELLYLRALGQEAGYVPKDRVLKAQ
jgi:glycosyltransferase involved in cell wall biosynthesis